MFSKRCLTTLTFGYEVTNPDSSGISTWRLDSTTDQIAICFVVDKAITINQIGINVSTVTGTPTYKVALQGVDTIGRPDGTDKTGTAFEWSPTVTGFQWLTLGASYAASTGEVLCIRIEDGTTGTDPNGSNYIDIAEHSSQTGRSFLPYLTFSSNSGGSWSSTTNRGIIYGFRNSADTTDARGFPVESPSKNSSQTCANIGEIHAQKIKIDKNLGSQVKIFGIYIDRVWVGKEYEVGIFDSAGATVVSVAVDDDHCINYTVDQSSVLVFFADTWINTDTILYVGCKLTEAGTNGASLTVHDAGINDNLSAFPGYPNNHVAFYNGASWANVASEISCGVSLLVSEFKAPVGVKPAIQPIKTGVVL